MEDCPPEEDVFCAAMTASKPYMRRERDFTSQDGEEEKKKKREAALNCAKFLKESKFPMTTNVAKVREIDSKKKEGETERRERR